MAQKSFLEIFNRYKPSDAEVIRVLSSVTQTNVRADKEKRLIQAEVSFDEIVNKDILYRIENEIKTAYLLNYVKLLPKYSRDLFNKGYFEQILLESERVGVVARGFFSGCDYEIEGEIITITIPFVSGGVTLLKNAETPQIIENIIFSEFGKRFKVNIVSDDKLASSSRERRRSEMQKFDREIIEQSKRYDSASAPTGTPKGEINDGTIFVSGLGIGEYRCKNDMVELSILDEMSDEVLYLTEIEGVEVLTDSNSGMGKVIFCRDKAFAQNAE